MSCRCGGENCRNSALLIILRDSNPCGWTVAGTTRQSREERNGTDRRKRSTREGPGSGHLVRQAESILPSRLAQTFKHVGVVFWPMPRTSPWAGMSNEAGATAMAFSSASFASAVRPIWPRAAASQR